MSISRTTSMLSKPKGNEPIPLATFAYLQARNKLRIFNLIRNEFKRSGLSQAQLAARMGKGTDRVSRMLGAPGNWTLDTVSDLLFAICGAVPDYSLKHPLDDATRNDRAPHWLEQTEKLNFNKQSDQSAKTSSTEGKNWKISEPA